MRPALAIWLTVSVIWPRSSTASLSAKPLPLRGAESKAVLLTLALLPELTLANLPPIQSEPAEADRIVFTGNQLQIPD